MSVIADKTRAVYRKYHMTVHETYVRDHFVKSSLKERRINGYNRDKSRYSQSSRHCDAVFLSDTAVKEPGREFHRISLKPRSLCHGGTDGNNILNGYKVLSAGNVATGLDTSATSTPNTSGYGALFGNFADMIIANWGNLDITVDNLTQATKGAVRLVLNSYWNYGVTRSGSFKTAALALS